MKSSKSTALPGMGFVAAIGFLCIAACGVSDSGDTASEVVAAAPAVMAVGEPRVLLEHVAPEPASWSPDGSMLLVDDQEHFGLRIVTIADGTVRALSEDPYHGYAEWSPVDELVAYVDKSQTGFFTLAIAEGAQPVRLVDGPLEGYAAPWSPDGSMLLFQRDGAVDVVEVASGNERTLIPSGSNGGTIVGARWSPDGRAVIAERRREIIVADLQGGQVRTVEGLSGRAPAFGADGAIWVIGAGRDRPLLRYRDGRSEQVEGLEKNVVSFDLHPSDGRLAVAVRGRGIVVLDAQGRGERVVVADPGAHSPRWSPDGQSIAFVCPDKGGVNLCVVRWEMGDLQ